MTTGSNFTLQGAAQLSAALQALGPHVATKVGQRANNRAGKVLADKLKAAAPQGTESTQRTRKNAGGVVTFDYGRLRQNIKARRQRARGQNLVVTIVTAGKAFWAQFLEFGTAKMAARPFWRSTQDAAIGEIVQAQADELKSGIDRAVDRLRRGLRP